MLEFKERDVSFFQRVKHNSHSAFFMPNLHLHEHYELYFLENGATTYFSGSSIYHLNTGDFIFIPSGVLHRTENADFPDFSRILFNFDDEFIGEEYLYIINELSSFAHIVIPEPALSSVRRLIAKIEAEDSSGAKDAFILKRTYFRELLLLLLRYRKPETISELSGTQKTAQDAAGFISKNYKQELSLKSLAKKYSVSAGYFSKLFIKHIGMGVNEYIKVCRIIAAKELLNSGELSVTEVAFECGFNDSNYFSGVFKRSVGMSPKKYAALGKAIK